MISVLTAIASGALFQVTCPPGVMMFPGVQVHDAHPAHDMANFRVKTWQQCQDQCCGTAGCKAFFHTTNQSGDAGNCTTGTPCCWLKPTWNASRIHDTCPMPNVCMSGVLPNPRNLTLSLHKIDPTLSPLAKCIDGTEPGYYFRKGVGNDARKVIVYLEGGGWCYPGDILQSSGANCAFRSKTGLGSSAKYPPSIPSTGYEGGSGYTSGDKNKTAFADFAVAYVKYCDGGSMTGTRMDPLPARNESGPMYFRGHFNLVAVLDDLTRRGSFTDVVLRSV